MLVGLVCGCASALFLWLLDLATDYRAAHVAIVFALPLAGLLLGVAYERYGASIAGGTNLVLRTLHEDGPALPVRLAPMVLLGTVATHLFGGSAGREGTAVQMGAGLAEWVAARLGLSPETRRQLLVAGIAGGFGSVFGTPIAGVVFSLEVLVTGRWRFASILPAVLASVIGDLVTRAWGIEHAAYPKLAWTPMTPLLLGKWLIFGVLVAAVTWSFIQLTSRLRALGSRALPRLPLRMALGGALVVLLWQLLGTDEYLGLGVPTILRAFADPALPADAFAWKLLFTAVTLAAGFLGGEVTPLFFVGAALGSASAPLLDLPLALAAGVGLAAVFAAAAHTPLALSIMAAELLGVAVLPHVAIVAVTAHLLVRRHGIYGAQRPAEHAVASSTAPPLQSASPSD